MTQITRAKSTVITPKMVNGFDNPRQAPHRLSGYSWKYHGNSLGKNSFDLKWDETEWREVQVSGALEVRDVHTHLFIELWHSGGTTRVNHVSQMGHHRHQAIWGGSAASLQDNADFKHQDHLNITWGRHRDWSCSVTYPYSDFECRLHRLYDGYVQLNTRIFLTTYDGSVATVRNSYTLGAGAFPAPADMIRIRTETANSRLSGSGTINITRI